MKQEPLQHANETLFDFQYFIQSIEVLFPKLHHASCPLFNFHDCALGVHPIMRSGARSTILLVARRPCFVFSSSRTRASTSYRPPGEQLLSLEQDMILLPPVSWLGCTRIAREAERKVPASRAIPQQGPCAGAP